MNGPHWSGEINCCTLQVQREMEASVHLPRVWHLILLGVLVVPCGVRAQEPGTHPQSQAEAMNAFRRALLRLTDDMTKSQVEELFGEPNRTSLDTCGSSTKQPWQCLQWTYAYSDGRALLVVYFGRLQGVWRVNSWSVAEDFG